MSNFEGKVALVTGGAHGIGKGIAKQFADRGAHTVIVDYNEENGKKTAEELTFGNVKSLFVKTDVSDPIALENVREQVFKPSDALIFWYSTLAWRLLIRLITSLLKSGIKQLQLTSLACLTQLKHSTTISPLTMDLSFISHLDPRFPVLAAE